MENYIILYSMFDYVFSGGSSGHLTMTLDLVLDEFTKKPARRTLKSISGESPPTSLMKKDLSPANQTGPVRIFTLYSFW